MRWPVVVLVLIAMGWSEAAGPPPWARTEARQPCAAFDLLRMPFFGDLHVHTRYSADAYIFGTRVEPSDVYAFAQGAAIPLSDDVEAQTRTATIDRPLDFAADTDHAEFFGEVNLCDMVGSPVYDSNQCQLLRRSDSPADQGLPTVVWLAPAGLPTSMPSHTNPPSSCSAPGVDCLASAISVWQRVQAAAEAAYDRTATCRFTTFIGYEYTASPLGKHLHRNVIFRNEHVPVRPASYLEAASLNANGVVTPEGLWTKIEDECLDAGSGCDAVIIPHNSNLSGGQQWLDPTDANDALRRQTLEPLVEIHQIKGNSECRFDRLAHAGAGTADELCSFEQQDVAQQGPAGVPVPIDQYPARNMVRNTLKDGVAFEDQLGVNPFKLGFVGGTDTHDGTAGNVGESGLWVGAQGNNDSSPARLIGDNMRNNPGGLTVAWAEENSRDALFAALRRRETYATSGTRPVVRFFAGELADVACGDGDFLDHAYASGVPMGGELGAVQSARGPRFAVWAMKDPGTAQTPGTDLQRVQIVKGWVDANGQTHERVFDVAGNAANGAGVDPATCAPTGSGARELCTVWRDPTFKRRERSFYYARVLENPTCRWSTRVCKAAGVDPLSPDCTTQAAAAGAAFANCCLGPANDAFLDPVIQERAWTSPIWYRPDAIARLRAAVRFGSHPGGDHLALRLSIGSLPRDLDPTRLPLTVRVTDDDEIFAVTIPPGTLQRQGNRFTLPAPLGGLSQAAFVLRGRHGASLALTTTALDLSHADRTEHGVTVALESGTWRASHTRFWVVRADRLVPGGH